MNTKHVPILAQTIVNALIEPFLKLPLDAPTHWLVDCTLGGGGHTAQFLKAFESNPQLRQHKILALDQDADSIARAHVRFQAEVASQRIELLHQNFGDVGRVLEGRAVLGLLADLGFSSDQLEDSNRGLSFQTQGPLDMRMDPSRGESCSDLLSSISEVELEKILREYGEERFSRRISSVLVENRSRGILPKTTKELVDTVIRAIPRSARHGKIHAATRTFQALRIAVNNELGELDQLLENAVNKIKPEGRVAILSFHSLEDRKVKYKFKNSELFAPLTKKPIEAGEEELKINSRARSAKLRIAERLTS